MSIIDKYLSGENRPIHPNVARCQQLVATGHTLAKVRFHRERQGLTFAPAKLYIEFVKNASPIYIDADWHTDIDAWLLNNGGKAESMGNEIERMGFSLVEALRAAPYEFGEGYTNAVLLEILHAEFTVKADIAKALKRVAYNAPSVRSIHYARAHDFIEACFQRVVTTLIKQLQYSPADAEAILCGSIVYLLDERFNITNRQILGLS